MKQKKSNEGSDKSDTVSRITNGSESLKLEKRLANIAAKARMDCLVTIQPSLMNDLLSSHEKASMMISNARKQFGNGAFSASQILKELGETVAKYSAESRLSYNPLVLGGNFFTSLPTGWVESMKRTSERLPDAIVLMSNAGWPLDYDVTPAEAVNLADMLDAGKKIEVDDYMTLVFEDNINDLFATFNRRHPLRVHIFGEILKCYKQEMFYAGISCVLSQIDGICNDFTSNDFFRSSNQKPNITHYLLKQSGNTDNWLLGPISKVPPVGRSINDKKDGDLNRHAVMHGIDIKYGSKINFLKSIAWLKYLSDVVWFDSSKNVRPIQSDIL